MLSLCPHFPNENFPISLLIINDYWWRDIFLIEILVLVYIGFLHRIQI